MFDCGRNIVDLGSICQLYGSFPVIGCTKDCFTDLMHTRLGKSTKSKDLTFVQIKTYILDQSRNGYILYRKYDFIGNFLPVIAAVVIARYFTSNHEFL